MARIGILTCSNSTQEANRASFAWSGDMRKRRGLFKQYTKDDTLELIGIINRAGCPSMNPTHEYGLM